MAEETVYCLDFDGVLVDSAREVGLAGQKALHALRARANASRPTKRLFTWYSGGSCNEAQENSRRSRLFLRHVTKVVQARVSR